MSKNYNISISLIVPALNEEKVIQKVLEDIYSIAKDSFNTFEIIAINDGSADATLEMMNTFAEKHKNINIINNKVNIGLGASFQAGLGLVKNEYVMLLCGDGGLPATSLPKIFEQVGNADLIIPYMSNLKTIKRPSRYVLSKAYVYLLNTVFGLNLNYYNGLPVYRKELLDKINITSSGFGFQAEIIIKLLKSGCTFHQVEVKGAEETGRSHALKFTNILSVANTFLHLIKEIVMFKPIVVDSTKTTRN